MSAVMRRSRQFYRKALYLELVLLGIISIVLVFWKSSVTMSFVLGAVAGFLPQTLFIYLFFFKKTDKNQNKLKIFYWGEAVKWLVTIALITFILLFYKNIYVFTFFFGYLLTLLLNNLSPMLLFWRLSKTG